MFLLGCHKEDIIVLKHNLNQQGLIPISDQNSKYVHQNVLQPLILPMTGYLPWPSRLGVGNGVDYPTLSKSFLIETTTTTTSMDLSLFGTQAKQAG